LPEASLINSWSWNQGAQKRRRQPTAHVAKPDRSRQRLPDGPTPFSRKWGFSGFDRLFFVDGGLFLAAGRPFSLKLCCGVVILGVFRPWILEIGARSALIPPLSWK
jgi:hypothetical protein